ncbi:MAG: glycoside hydrolase family 88 protein [Clostridia bacterium]
MNKLFKSVVSLVTAATMSLSVAASMAVTAGAAEDKGAIMPTYESTIAAVEKANDYYQSTVAYNKQEYGIPNCFWAKAAYETGNMEAYYTTGIEAYRDYATAWAMDCNWQGHGSTNKSAWTWGYSQTMSGNAALFGDFQICFQTYIDLYNIEKNESKGAVVDNSKIARAIEVMSEEISRSNDDFWWWADSLYMVMPVMTKLYKVTQDEKYLDGLYRFWKYAKELMYDGPGGIPSDATGYTTSAKLTNGAKYSDPDNYAYLFFRDAGYVYPLKPNPGHENEKNFWARGDGWVFAGLAKVLQDMPDDYEHYNDFLQTYLEMAPAIKACMRVDENGYGFWTQSMLQGYPTSASNPNGYETSGTAFFTYGFAWGINSGVLDRDEYLETAVRAWNYLANIALQPDGMVGYTQYIGSNAVEAMGPRNNQNFGTGAYLLAGCEMSRLVGGSQGDIYPQLQRKMETYIAFRVNTPHYYTGGKIGHIEETDHKVEVYLKVDDNGNRTSMIPARLIVETFGGNVAWNEAARTVTATIGDRTVVFTVGSNVITVNGEAMTAPTATEIVGGRTFVPLRALAESLGKKVYWSQGDSPENGLIVIGHKATPFYSCDTNLVEMLRNMLGKPETYPTRPAQKVKDFAPKITPVSATARGTKINLTSVTYSQEPEANNPGRHVIDNTTGTYWASNGSATAVVDLGSNKPVSSVGVLFRVYDDDRTIPFSIYVSNDNSKWELVGASVSVARSNKPIYMDANKSARYVKFQFDGNSISGWNSVDAIEVYEGDASSVSEIKNDTTTNTANTTTTNKATGTKINVSASSVTFSQEPEAKNPGKNAFDGNAATVWASQNAANAVIDLGKSTPVSSAGVKFMVYGDDRTIPFSVAVSDDKATWTTVYTGSSVPYGADFIYVTVGKNARYVKFTFEGNTVSGWSSVAEMEVYTGDVTAADTETTTTTANTVEGKVVNAATGSKVTLTANMLKASATPEAENHAGNLIDGNKQTVWASQNQSNVVIDLGSKKTLSCVGVAMKMYDDTRTIPYDIEVSVDGTTYTKVWSGDSEPQTDTTKYVSFSADAQYVRITAYGNTVSGWNSVAEVEVYSK